MLSIDPRECRPLLDAVRPPPPPAARATRSSLAGDAVAINADFFVLPGAAS